MWLDKMMSLHSLTGKDKRYIYHVSSSGDVNQEHDKDDR